MSGVRGATERLPALDAMRGLVMALMAVDHVDAIVNAHHAQGDSAQWSQPVPLSPPDFLTRWCSHLCAPTFVFLAGLSIALSSARGAADPEARRRFDLQLLLRGLSLVVIELLLVSSAFHLHFAEGEGWAWRPVYLQVIYAIGAAMMAMAALRHLPLLVQGGLVVALLVACEHIVVTRHAAHPEPLWSMLLFHFGPWRDWASRSVLVLYPLVPWLAVMLLGHVVGKVTVARGISPRWWALAGVASLSCFGVLRGIDGFGNMGLHRRDDAWIEWLHCSKYPPSLTFLSMELGLMAVAVAAMAAWSRRSGGHPGRTWRALVVLGRVPMFFYLVHLVLIGAVAWSGLVPGHSGTWRVTWALAGVVVVVCLPACAAYGRYKRARGGWTRFL